MTTTERPRVAPVATVVATAAVTIAVGMTVAAFSGYLGKSHSQASPPVPTTVLVPVTPRAPAEQAVFATYTARGHDDDHERHERHHHEREHDDD